MKNTYACISDTSGTLVVSSSLDGQRKHNAILIWEAPIYIYQATAILMSSMGPE